MGFNCPVGYEAILFCYMRMDVSTLMPFLAEVAAKLPCGWRRDCDSIFPSEPPNASSLFSMIEVCGLSPSGRRRRRSAAPSSSSRSVVGGVPDFQSTMMRKKQFLPFESGNENEATGLDGCSIKRKNSGLVIR